MIRTLNHRSAFPGPEAGLLHPVLVAALTGAHTGDQDAQVASPEAQLALEKNLFTIYIYIYYIYIYIYILYIHMEYNNGYIYIYIYNKRLPEEKFEKLRTNQCHGCDVPKWTPPPPHRNPSKLSGFL